MLLMGVTTQLQRIPPSRVCSHGASIHGLAMTIKVFFIKLMIILVLVAFLYLVQVSGPFSLQC